MPGEASCRLRATGRKPSRMKWIRGRSSQSRKHAVACRGNPLTSAAFDASRKATVRATASGLGSTSTSRNTSVSWPAARASCQQACCFPHHPAGKGLPGTSRTRGSTATIPATISAVRSSLESSRMTSSRSTPSLASTSRQSRPIAPSSFRAGTSTETRGGPPPVGGHGAGRKARRLARVTATGSAASVNPTSVSAAIQAGVIAGLRRPRRHATHQNARPAARPAPAERCRRRSLPRRDPRSAW